MGNTIALIPTSRAQKSPNGQRRKGVTINLHPADFAELEREAKKHNCSLGRVAAIRYFKGLQAEQAGE